MTNSAKNKTNSDSVRINHFHSGPMGKVLERYLQRHHPSNDDYSLIALERLWQLAAQVNPAIGLHLFSQFSPNDYHVLAYSTLLMDSVEETFTCWEKYACIASITDQVRKVEDGGLIGVELEVNVPETLEQYMVQHYAVMYLTLLKQGAGEHISPRLVQFKHKRPEYYADYRKVLGEAVSFDQGHNRILFDQATAHCKITSGNKTMMGIIANELDRQLMMRQRLDGWTGKVALYIYQAFLSGETPSLAVIAESMYTGERTLRRRLSDEGSSYRKIMDLVRAELDQYFQFQGLPDSEVSERLGYSESSAYVLARKRWR